MQQGAWQGMVMAGALLVTGIAGCGDSSVDHTEADQAVDEAVEEVVIIDHEITLDASTQGDEWVILHIDTTLPGNLELMASVTMEGEGDYHIAHMSHRVPISGGKGETAFQMTDFPSGEYRVMASFYPRWGYGDRSLPDGVDGDTSIEGGPEWLEVVGSGEPAHEYAERQEARHWVRENVTVGSAWNADSWVRRFGEWEEFPATKRNPEIIKNYYFPYLDMTIVVNVMNKEIATWMMGRDGL